MMDKGQQLNLFQGQAPEFTMLFPELAAPLRRIGKNSVRQVIKPEKDVKVTFRTQQVGNRVFPIALIDKDDGVLVAGKYIPRSNSAGFPVLKILGSNSTDPSDIVEDLRSGNFKLKWIISPAELASEIGAVDDIRKSWQDSFNYREDNPKEGTLGLRTPQIGALHAILAHWSINPKETGTIVMPTGTGKTETMLALLVNQQLDKLLVIVPTNPLRDQIAKKFEELGILKSLNVVGKSARLPIVGKLKHGIPTAEEAGEFIGSCNVIVSTMAAINTCSEEVQAKFVELCPNLLIDEAHHAPAPSWDALREKFAGNSILQFTATPFRNNGKYVGGKIIYSYPLGKAQEDGYFTKINFSPVFAYTEQDQAIAEEAISLLDTDIAAGFDHIVMARTKTITRAEDIQEIYQRLAPNHNPLLINSSMTESQRKDVLQKISNRDTRIIVCVDMLGEGFDLPELKIAAMHDIHKSLAITLQFTGRFTRVRHGGNVGEAKVVVNIADAKVKKQIKALYAEDADWNKLIKEYSQTATSAEQQRSDFLHSFVKLPAEVSVQNIEPRMSTVVYKSTGSDWEPDNITMIFSEDTLFTKEIAINNTHKVAWFVTEEHTKIKWGNLKGIDNVTYDLYVLHWDDASKLLFINSSNNSSIHEELAKAVGGDSATIIRGDTMYKSMHGINRMVPINLGLTDITSRTTRYTMFAGSDVAEGLDQSQTRNKTKTNMFGFGYEDGNKVSIGCSQKGRVWSYLAASDIGEWIKWCQHVGKKLTDNSIDLATIYGSFVRPKHLEERPQFVPLAVEWPLSFLDGENTFIKTATEVIPLYDVSLQIADHSTTGAIKFDVITPNGTYGYEINIVNERTKYIATQTELHLVKGQTEKPLSEWLNERPLRIIFEGDRIIEDDLYFEYNSNIPQYDSAKIQTLDWTGTDLRKESQGLAKSDDSIQRKIIQELLNDQENWSVIFDDDSSGEVADVVAMKIDGDQLIVNLYHCKFSEDGNTGARVTDFYAVCGQAQKSIFWREHSDKLIPRLIERARKRVESGQASRFEKGDFKDLSRIGWKEQELQKKFKIFIVQPGLSKAQVTDPILNLLGATSLYLKTTFNVELEVIASE